MAGADDYFRGETLDILFDVLDEDLLDEVFEDDINNIITEVNIKHIFRFLLALQDIILAW